MLWTINKQKKQTKTNSVALVRERIIPTERPPLVNEISANFADRGYSVVNATDHYDCILGFLDRSRYSSFQVAPQLYSRGWVDPVPDPLLLRKSDNAGNRTRTPGCVVRNSDHSTTEVVCDVNCCCRTVLEGFPCTTQTNLFLWRANSCYCCYCYSSVITPRVRLPFLHEVLSLLNYNDVRCVERQAAFRSNILHPSWGQKIFHIRMAWKQVTEFFLPLAFTSVEIQRATGW
jgi:hypothetical protein